MLQLKILDVGGEKRLLLCDANGEALPNQVTVDVFQSGDAGSFIEVRFAIDNEKVKLS